MASLPRRGRAAVIASARFDPRPLDTHQLPLARAGDAFELLRARPDGFAKALVMP